MSPNSKIERFREKLNKALENFKRNSPEVYKMSQKMDKLINHYYETEVQYPTNSMMPTYYYTSYKHLADLIKETGEFPTIKEWDEYAMKNILLSHVSIEYISGMNWHKLRDYMLQEIK